MEYGSAVKKNCFAISNKWMDLEDIILNEISHWERQTLNDITYIWNLKDTTN